MFEVKDGARTLQFNGTLLGESSSYRRGSTRWIEFSLYRTESGSYVLSRVGVSLVFHGAACPLVRRYNLIEGTPENLNKDAIPCEECDPDRNLPVVFPEKYRNWAQVFDRAEYVLDALYKYDSRGSEYLTNVAKRLLEVSSEKDIAIDNVYGIELIP
jgi:hypothetical protein